MVIAACLVLAAAGALAQEAPHYEPWGESAGGENSTAEMVTALRNLIQEAERSRAADPHFLGDLKALANFYDIPAPVSVPADIVRDDFRDGNFDRGTVWRVTRGRWWVESDAGLRSVVAAAGAAPAAAAEPTSEPPPRAGDDFADAVIGNILNQVLRPDDGVIEPHDHPESVPAAQTSGDSLPADIQVEVAIPNAFHARIEISSRERFGELRAGVYQVSTQNGWGYALAYSPGAQAGLRLMRVARGQHTVIGYRDGPVNLEDGRLHVIEWERGFSGEMTVSLDGVQLLRVTDTRLHDPFTLFAFANQGGDYAIRDFAIRAAR